MVYNKNNIEKRSTYILLHSLPIKFVSSCGSTVAQWSRFKGFYTQVWGSNPRQRNFYRKRSGFQFPEKANYAKNQRKCLQEIFSMAQGIPSGMDLIGLLRVMQSGVNPQKAGRIVGCNIIYVIFLIICNSIINQTKKKLFPVLL